LVGHIVPGSCVVALPRKKAGPHASAYEVNLLSGMAALIAIDPDPAVFRPRFGIGVLGGFGAWWPISTEPSGRRA
jgi:hypothetical protein